MQIAAQAPQAPTAPVGVGSGTPAIRVPGTDLPIPITPREVETIREQREELSDQLLSAAGRRDRLADELSSIPVSEAATRQGIVDRITVLDERIVQLERDIAATGRQLTMAPQSALVPPDVPILSRLSTEQITGISIVFTIFVLFPLTVAFATMLWRRLSTPRVKRDKAEVERLDRLEQAVDSVAIEVERIGEGQRFMTRLLTESNGMAALAGVERNDEISRGRQKG